LWTKGLVALRELHPREYGRSGRWPAAGRIEQRRRWQGGASGIEPVRSALLEITLGHPAHDVRTERVGKASTRVENPTRSYSP